MNKHLKPGRDTNLNHPRSEVDRSDCNLRLVWSSMEQKKSSFRSLNLDLDWLKGTQPLIPILVSIFHPRMATSFPGFLSFTCPEEKVVAEVGLLEGRKEKKKE